MIGRFVDVTASPTEVEVFCDGQRVAHHRRSWARRGVITDPAHVTTAQQMRRALAGQRHRQEHQRQQLREQKRRAETRQHADGHLVALRPLPDYDALFGIDVTDFNPDTGPESTGLSSTDQTSTDQTSPDQTQPRSDQPRSDQHRPHSKDMSS